MASDARLSTALPSHPKTKKLARRLGPAGPLGCIYLFLWAAANRSDGDLSGMTDEDIELAVDWVGEAGVFVREMVDVGFLDGAVNAYAIHDWAEHNPWAASASSRAEKSRWAALCKQHGRREAARLMPDYALRLEESSSAKTADSGASGTHAAVPESASGTQNTASGSAPSPSPSPSPSPEELKSSLRSDSSNAAGVDLLGDGAGQGEKPDLKTRKTDRIRQIAEQAQAAYNAILAKPHGLLSACTVLNKPRIKAVEKALPTVRQLCQRLFGNERVTPQFWQLYFETAESDDFHAGRQPGGPGHENWQPDFEYLLRETVIAKLADRALSEVTA